MVIDTSKLTAGSWKTSLAGYAVLISGLIAANPGDFVKWPTVVLAAKYIALLAAAAGFKFAKDGNVTGGTTLATGAVPDARLHAEAVVAKVETPAEASPAPAPPKP
jgi:hypothetical protein